MSNIIRVGILRGGPSAEAEVSHNTGQAVMRAISENLSDKYRTFDIIVDKDGNWLHEGNNITPTGLHSLVDVVFNALHGTYGEDGKVQSVLEWHNIPFTGSGSTGSAMGMNKVMTKKILNSYGIKNPYGVTIESGEIQNEPENVLSELYHSFVMPAVVKPSANGSSVGVSIVRKFDEFYPALYSASRLSPEVIVEEYIKGIETTCGVIDNFRGQRFYALPPIEIRSKKDFFDYEAKYQSQSEEICPATFSLEIKQEIENLSKKIHEVMGLRHYSRSDFIVHPKRGIYTLEVNTLPGLTNESLIPKSLHAVGSSLHHLVDHLLNLARREV
jgi:D-alanine-D-alanine ligase